MILVVGLGNYPDKYAQTRHNFGFLAIDYLAKKFQFPEFKFEKKFFGRVASGIINGQKILLLKPETLMNLSGKSVLAVKQFYKISEAQCFIFSDDLDMDFGKTRFKEKGSSGGQRGIEDIIFRLNTSDIARVKFGITNENKAKMPVENFVLSRFSKEEWEQVPKICEEGVEKFLVWLKTQDNENDSSKI